MSSLQTAPEVLDREFLEIRAKILELAACFDRLERAPGNVEHAPRMVRLGRTLDLVREHRSDRAEQVLLAFSREYDEDWQEQFGL